jgi:hypothetical protein
MKQKSLLPGQALGMNDMQKYRHGVIGHPGQEPYQMKCMEAQCSTPAFRDRQCGCVTSLVCALSLPLLLFSWPISVRCTNHHLWAQHEELSREYQERRQPFVADQGQIEVSGTMMSATGWVDTQVWPPQQQVVVQELEVLEETSDDAGSSWWC